MGRNAIRLVIILAVSTVIGILAIQFFFMKNTVDLREKRFHEAATLALKAVGRDLLEYNDKVKGRPASQSRMVETEQISNNYYVVNVNEEINPALLEHFLLKEFKKHNLDVDFEYAVYDCDHKEMVYVGSAGRRDSIVRRGCRTDEDFFEDHYSRMQNGKPKCSLPTCAHYTYYFGVHFTGRSKYYSSHIHAWYVINGILAVVILFFGYTLYIIVKQRKLSEIQKNFINNLTHEFKTPIASINLSAKVLADPGIARQPERMGKYSGIIETQAKKLSQHVEKILQMASIEKKKTQIHKQDIVLQDFIRDHTGDFENSREHIDYSVTFRFPEDPVHVKADPFHFGNVVLNILDNAFKYCRERPEVTISIEQKKRSVELVFADRGIGIPKQYRRKIFARFYRVPTGNIHDVKGFGLGLDYVKKIIEKHGWKISVADHLPEGSMFTISIPV